MDSRLDAIFRTGFQPAEKTDTWQGLKREEKTGERKSRGHDREDEKAKAPEDDAAISVAALHNFLLMLLEQSKPQGEAPAPPATAAESELSPAPSPEMRRASAAASAYQTTARTTAPRSSVSLSDTPPPPSAGPAIALSIEEQRRIHRLLADVETLAARGIPTITLQKADTFLESLAKGVAAALER